MQRLHLDSRNFSGKIAAFAALFLLLCVQKSLAQDFSYEGVLGPDHWRDKYQTCSGKYQSPINIDLVNVKKKSFPELVFTGFDKDPKTATMMNNGHTVLINMDYDIFPEITGGPLNSSYRFAQFHFHWGDNDTYGSEDMINNQSYPIELHMVLYKTNYGEFENALNFADGLVVLAYFYELSENSNPFYEEFLAHLDQIPTPGLKTVILNPPKLQDLMLTASPNFFTYIGSLTTPPCSEVVTWIDFDEPIPISHEQIMQFRNLYSYEGQHLLHNFRPVQPLNGRIVYQNISPEDKVDSTDTKSDFDDIESGNDLEALVPNTLSNNNDIDDLAQKAGCRIYVSTPMDIIYSMLLVTLTRFSIRYF